jgi:hypothetical protein
MNKHKESPKRSYIKPAVASSLLLIALLIPYLGEPTSEPQADEPQQQELQRQDQQIEQVLTEYRLRDLPQVEARKTSTTAAPAALQPTAGDVSATELKAWQSLESGDLRLAADLFHQELRNNPDNIHVRKEWLRLKIDVFYELDDVISDLTALCASHPEDTEFITEAVQRLWSGDHMHDALQVLELLDQDSLSTELKITKAGIYRDLNELSLSLSIYQEVQRELAEKGSRVAEIDQLLAEHSKMPE